MSAIERMAAARATLQDFVETVPLSPLRGHEVRAEVEQAFAAAKGEILQLRESEERAWRERNRAAAKVRGWEQISVSTVLRPVTVEEWGPGEGDSVTIATPTPQRLTDLLDELARLRAAQGIETPTGDETAKQAQPGG